MTLYDANGQVVIAVAVRRPGFNGRGRTWDTQTITIDGVETPMHYDSTWGWAGYFKRGNRWYRVPFRKNFAVTRDIGTTRVMRFTTTEPTQALPATSVSVSGAM